MEAAEESIQRRALLYDKDGDYHYDTISAFIKSVRGSDPDASLYWLAKMVRAGEDPAFIFRRMIILAMEDVGLADPGAITTVISCAEAFDRIGFPEGNFALSQACLRLATAAKSNTTMAYFDALREVEREDTEVPNHLKDASRDGSSFGHGEGYIYPHAYRQHWAAQQYLPSALKGRVFYNPSISGYEAEIREELQKKREIQAALILGSNNPENLSWSSSSRGREGWFKRLESGRSSLLLADRDRIFSENNVARHNSILILHANDGLLLWESLRRTPEGLTAALVDSQDAKDALLRFPGADFDESEKPHIAVLPECIPSPDMAEELFSCNIFDHIIGREFWRKLEKTETGMPDFGSFARDVKKLLAPEGNICFLLSPPKLGERISRILKEECNADASLCKKLSIAENDFFNSSGDNLDGINWDIELINKAFLIEGFIVKITEIEQKEERLVTTRDLSIWFNSEKSSWGAFILSAIGEKNFKKIQGMLEMRITESPLLWKWKSFLVSGRKAGENL